MKSFDEVLKAAYDAGYAAGSDDESYNARGVGPHTDREPTFEEWRASLSGLETLEDLGSIEIGDTVQVIGTDSTFSPIRGARCRVEMYAAPNDMGQKRVVLAHGGLLWAIPLAGVKKVRP